MSVWPSEEWMEQYSELINSSPEYKEAAHDWEGVLVYHFQAEPDKHLGEDVYGWFDLWHGQCREAKQPHRPEGAGWRSRSRPEGAERRGADSQTVA